MPAARDDIDRAGIAARCALQGIRPVARDTGLPYSTVKGICDAEGVKLPEKAMRLVPVENKRQTASAQSWSAQASAQPAHAVVTDELHRLGSESRLSAALYAHRTLAYSAEMADNDAETALARAGDVKSVVGIAQGANVPGFEREREQAANTVVNIALLGVDPASCAIDITSTALPSTAQE